MSTLRVTPGQLETLGASTHRSCAEVRATQQQLTAQLQPLFGADWSGTAAAQFAALYGNFEQHARGLADALDGIASLLGRAGAAYADVEQEVAASFR
jgi:WXG100 family type VII secretion target